MQPVCASRGDRSHLGDQPTSELWEQRHLHFNLAGVKSKIPKLAHCTSETGTGPGEEAAGAPRPPSCLLFASGPGQARCVGPGKISSGNARTKGMSAIPVRQTVKFSYTGMQNQTSRRDSVVQLLVAWAGTSAGQKSDWMGFLPTPHWQNPRKFSILCKAIFPQEMAYTRPSGLLCPLQIQVSLPYRQSHHWFLLHGDRRARGEGWWLPIARAAIPKSQWV